MNTMNFSRTEGDTSEPAGVVVRTKNTGKIDFTIINGGNTQVNEALNALDVIVDSIGFEAFIESAKAALTGAGLNLEELLANQDINSENTPED